MQLTRSQRIGIETAREALAEAKNTSDHAYMCGMLGYEVEKLLGIIADLTDGNDQ